MEAMILSRALDTNGQNARFVRASQKHGEDPDVIRAIAIGNADPAAVVTRFRLAAEKHGGLVIREAHRSSAYFEFPTDIIWDGRTELQIKKLAQEADVIHLNNSDLAYKHFRLRKPALLHHHGSLFRSNPKRLLDIAKHHKMVQAVSTVDLLQYAPERLTWLPSAYDVDELAAFAETNRREPDGRIRIVHCPTNRAGKHTELFLTAIAELQAEKLPIDLVMVENQTWAESLKAKASADIVYDQLLYGYGCNSIEAWAMGKPVISGADEWTLGRMASMWSAVPFEEATDTTLKDVLRAMVKLSDLREDAAERGLAHVRTYHDEKPALEKLAELYAKAIRTFSRPRIYAKSESTTFRQKGRKAVYFEDTQIPFTDGEITTDDPMVIARLRTLAKRPRAFGIEEVA